MQVITPENHVEFITTGKVPEFKAPEAKTEAKPDAKAADATEKPAPGAADAAKAKDEPKRDGEGKFAKAGDTPAVDADADADAKLTEKVTRLINKKHREMREAQEFATGEGRRAIEAERRAEQLQREIDALKGKKSDGPNTDKDGGVDPDEPKQGDFKTVGEYTRALTKYEVGKAAKDAKANAKAEASTTKQQEQAGALVSAFAERQEAFKAATPDYEDVVGSTDLIVPNIALQYLIESDVGPQLGYYLAKNPDEVTRLQKLSPSRCVAELGKLETKFEKAAAPAKADAGVTKEISKAPAPISPLEGKEAAVQKDPSQMTFQELRAFRQQQARAKS